MPGDFPSKRFALEPFLIELPGSGTLPAACGRRDCLSGLGPLAIASAHFLQHRKPAPSALSRVRNLFAQKDERRKTDSIPGANRKSASSVAPRESHAG
jgi:hypothetical protein